LRKLLIVDVTLNENYFTQCLQTMPNVNALRLVKCDAEICGPIATLGGSLMGLQCHAVKRRHAETPSFNPDPCSSATRPRLHRNTGGLA